MFPFHVDVALTGPTRSLARVHRHAPVTPSRVALANHEGATTENVVLPCIRLYMYGKGERASRAHKPSSPHDDRRVRTVL